MAGGIALVTNAAGLGGAATGVFAAVRATRASNATAEQAASAEQNEVDSDDFEVG